MLLSFITFQKEEEIKTVTSNKNLVFPIKPSTKEFDKSKANIIVHWFYSVNWLFHPIFLTRWLDSKKLNSRCLQGLKTCTYFLLQVFEITLAKKIFYFHFVPSNFLIQSKWNLCPVTSCRKISQIPGVKVKQKSLD